MLLGLDVFPHTLLYGLGQDVHIQRESSNTENENMTLNFKHTYEWSRR